MVTDDIGCRLRWRSWRRRCWPFFPGCSCTRLRRPDSADRSGRRAANRSVGDDNSRRFRLFHLRLPSSPHGPDGVTFDRVQLANRFGIQQPVFAPDCHRFRPDCVDRIVGHWPYEGETVRAKRIAVMDVGHSAGVGSHPDHDGRYASDHHRTVFDAVRTIFGVGNDRTVRLVSAGLAVMAGVVAASKPTRQNIG